jgi:glycosyltransferase involved in cell wall biosynthesis
MRVSVVIPTYNRVHLLRRTLPAILDQEFPAEHFEVIVVVDASTDGTLEYLQSLHFPRPRTLVHERNRGLAAARQTGLTAAEGELVLFLDDDMVADRRLVAEHVAAHNGATTVVACGALFLHPNSPESTAADCFNAELGAFYLEHKKHPTLVWDGTWVFGNASAPRSILIAAGGFDEQFRMYEDLELGLRLEALGVGQRYEPTAVAYQIYEKTARELLLDAWEFGKADVLLVRKHREYRHRSAIARLVQASAWRRVLWQLVTRSPISPDLALAVPYWLTERCRAIPICRRAALRLLCLRRAVAWGRAVIDDMPDRSWKALVAQFQ